MTVALLSSIQLKLSTPLSTVDRLHYQLLTIELTSPDRLIEPQDLTALPLPAGIDTTGGVVITGRAPVWLYAYLVHELHPTAWVACFDPRFNAGVVVATHSRLARIGQVIPIEQPKSTRGLAPALLVVGPPDSGKSVFSHALFQALLPDYPDVFLQRANWDGEGNWILELPEEATEDDREAFKRSYKGELTEGFFGHHAQAILQLRQRKQLVIVDVGGRVQPEKQPILEACSHYLIISSNPAEIEKRHEFCRDRGNLQCVGIIASSLDKIQIVHRHELFLEMTCGPWLQGSTEQMPEVLLEEVRSLIQ